MSKLVFDMGEVVRLYEEEYLTCAEISQRLGGSEETIRKRLKGANVCLRPAIKRAACMGQEAEIARLYCDEKLTLKSIAKITGVGKETIRIHLLNTGIQTRTSPEARKGKKFTETTKQKLSDIRRKIFADPIKRKRILDAMYVGRKDPKYIEHLKEFHTGRKHSPDTLKKLSDLFSGPKNPSWRGGLSYAPYCPKFNERIKESVRESFGRKCYLCSMTEEENGKRLSVHHVDYNKGQGCGQSWSLLPLCKPCHVRTNTNRHYWFARLNGYWLDKYINEFTF